MNPYVEEIFGHPIRKLLVIGIGGGGDVVTAATLGLWLRRCSGVEAYIASFAWERFVIDPEPGPIPLECFKNARAIGDNVVLVNKDSYVIRNGRRFSPQAVYVSEAIGEPVYIIDLWGGAEGVVRGIRLLLERHGVDAVIGVDVGGDVLAEGDEEDLWSPLADTIGLASIASFKDSVLAVHGIGCDGELKPGYVLNRIALVARMGGLITAKGITPYEAGLLERVLGRAVSEASRIPLMAYKGFIGGIGIRGGSRVVEVSPLQTITFFLRANIVAAASRLVEAVRSTRSLEEANDALNRMCVYTEYNLEQDLKSTRTDIRKVSGETLLKLRNMFRKRLQQMCCKKVFS